MKIKTLVVGSFEANCYLFSSGNELIVIDPGDETKRILDEINKTGKSLKQIIHTHYHFDHTLKSDEVKQATGADVLIHQQEKDFIDFNVDRFLKNDEIITIGSQSLKIIHTPGHTLGSICLLGDDFIFTGDTLFEYGYGRFDLPGGDEQSLKKSLRYLELILRQDMMIYPGHGVPFKYKKNEQTISDYI
ncbi:MBL fold metallo-hydrolase [Patescibacteria group bacterium]|nr:MBL fold metallo-hydrolase [Patescibacteria group bacterium]